MENWAVDIKDVTTVYPWAGMEWLMVLVLVACWLVWHIAQARVEKREFDQAERDFNAEHSSTSIDRY